MEKPWKTIEKCIQLSRYANIAERPKNSIKKRIFIDHSLIIYDRMKIEVETSFIYKSISQVDADVIDRLNNRYTAIALVACFLIIGAKIYVGNPINCWGPSKFRELIFLRRMHIYSRLLAAPWRFSSHLNNYTIEIIQPASTNTQRFMKSNFSF